MKFARHIAALLALAFLSGCASLTSLSDNCADTEVIDSTHQLHKPVRSWKAMKNDFVVMQQSDYTCGAACLATISQYYWGDEHTELEFMKTILKRLTLPELEDRVKNGLSMTDLRKAAVDVGYEATIAKVTFAQLMEGKAPVVVRIDHRGHEHFVVVRGFAEDRVFLADPIRGNVRMSVDVFAQEWNDGAILIMAKPDAELPESHALEITEPSPVTPEYESARKAMRYTWPGSPAAGKPQ